MNQTKDLHGVQDTVGPASWVQRTSGRLTTAERRALLRPLARTHVQNAVGRLRLALGVHPGRHAHVAADRLRPPTSPLTRVAEQRARGILPGPLLHHSYRTYVYGRALGELESVDVDTELLYAGALLHDTGLVDPTGDADFTLTSSRLARAVAEDVGLSTAATDTLLTAITLHCTPGVTAAAGPVAYLLAAGAAADAVGLRCWELPSATLADAAREHPRDGFPDVFIQAFRHEAVRVPEGRARLLLRYGALTAAIRFAPFSV
ncbi:HD domain-containing protein [Friedmanniella luteola]|uniref:HD domain-containing protein n=1 Tax=Friedmanniella luteola TaxID=546871 RepID=A0A1H1MQZ2_9ACTN|nr:HD domain-containing protein [Friedmanniella luteola]SDR89062.1 HD domain-containing protein [Friedmanniella luteola]